MLMKPTKPFVRWGRAFKCRLISSHSRNLIIPKPLYEAGFLGETYEMVLTWWTVFA
jgi:hypothetical protein